MEPALLERIWQSVGFPRHQLDDGLSDVDMDALRYIAAVLESGFPLVAFLQLVRVYGQSMSRIADAETRLFHLYVHEPLMRDGVPGLEMAEEMETLAADLLPLVVADHGLHPPALPPALRPSRTWWATWRWTSTTRTRSSAACAWRSPSPTSRATPASPRRPGEEEAFSTVERFIDAVTDTLPDDARVVKTIGDEVMLVGQDVQALTDWAVGFQRLYRERPTPRIGVHVGSVLYRDGDYFGREVNLAARVVARARGGEVIVTDAVMSRSRPPSTSSSRRSAR